MKSKKFNPFQTQTVLIVIIAFAVGAGLGAITAVEVYLRPAAVIRTVSQTSIQQTPGTSLAVVTSSEAVFEAYQSIKNATETYVGYDLLPEWKAILITKSLVGTSNKVYSLWYAHTDPRYPLRTSFVRSFNDHYGGLSASFTKDGDHTVFVIGSDYYRYDQVGREEFAFEQKGNRAVVREGYFGGNYSIELVFSSPCSAKMGYENGTYGAILSGIRIENTVHPLMPSKVPCLANEMLSAPLTWYEPTLSFGGFDPVYSTLELNLPDGKRSLIDVQKKKIVTTKEKYSTTCFGVGDGKNHFLTYETPSGITMLMNDVLDDPLMKPYSESENICLIPQDKKIGDNPTFLLSVSGGEGPGTDLGIYEFDLKMRAFKKIN